MRAFRPAESNVPTGIAEGSIIVSWSRIIKATVFAMVISIICLLPPGIHFVSGPLGPLIGGYFAGSRTRLRPSEAAVVGLLMALLVGIPAPIILRELNVLPPIETIAIVFFSSVGALYFGGLGGIAAGLGGRAAQREQPS